MFYAILILLIILLLAGYIYEKREGMAALRAAKRYESELEEERKWSDKMCKERNDAIKRCIELEKAQNESGKYEKPVAEIVEGDIV